MSIAAIVASTIDNEARRLVSQFRKTGVATVLVTPASVCGPGWSFEPGNLADSYFTADGCRYDMLDLTGVYVRLPFVTPAELLHLTGPDRGYGASEVHAFLVAWLTELGARVVNRPSPSFLAGPGVDLAAMTDPPGPPLRRPFTEDVTIVGRETFSSTRDDELDDRALDIGRRIHCRFFTVTFDRGITTTINYWPALTAPVRAALQEELR